MPVKTTGAEFKRFYSDPAFWPDGTWHEEAEIRVNGELIGESADLNTVPDDAEIKIAYGIVFGPHLEENEPTFEAYFKRWHQLQTTASFLVECDLSKVDAVKARVRAAGGRISD